MYTIQYFIDKFSSIPWYKWCKNTQINWLGQRCAFGHLTPKEVKRCVFYSSKGIPEMEALEAIGDKYFGPLLRDKIRAIALVNNGEHPDFKQRTCKARVLAALKWAQQQETVDIINNCFKEQEEPVNA